MGPNKEHTDTNSRCGQRFVLIFLENLPNKLKITVDINKSSKCLGQLKMHHFGRMHYVNLTIKNILFGCARACKKFRKVDHFFDIFTAAKYTPNRSRALCLLLHALSRFSCIKKTFKAEINKVLLSD